MAGISPQVYVQTPHLCGSDTDWYAQYQLGNHPRDDAGLQENPNGGSADSDARSRRLSIVQLDHHRRLRVHPFGD
jgi:hypothetical protein